MILPEATFTHLLRLTDERGLYEHARGAQPRREGGYCVDDNARALVVLARAPELAVDPQLRRAHRTYLSMLIGAQDRDGGFRNRLGPDGTWRDRASVEDCWGRALWGLGATVSSPFESGSGALALATFTTGARRRSPWPRAMAFAALGAAEVLKAVPDHPEARALLAAAADRIGRPRRSPSWPWPEDRLSYANAVLAETLLATGAALGDTSRLADGQTLLGWLLDSETRDGHLSVTPVGGRGPGEMPPGFDQQPIEVAALADACARAYALTGQARWAQGVEMSAAWFLGANDNGTPMNDEVSGGGCDGLERDGRNENQGAESTLALLSTLEHARRFAGASR